MKPGALLAKDVPPPDKLGKAPPMAEGEPEGDEGDNEAAELSAMEAFTAAESPEEKLAAFKDLLSICGY